MKTLDEVIFEAPYSPTPWEADALHYLKDYRMLVADFAEKRKELEDEKARYQEAVRNCEKAENKYRRLEDELNGIRREHIKQMKNDPLTWDELREMEGKPVWVEVYDPIDEKTGWHTASWKLIEFINDEYFDVRDSDGEQKCFYKSENDCYCWQAYRKERK